MLNQPERNWKTSLPVCAGLLIFGAVGLVAVETISGAAAQVERSADGLPLYDERLGPPKSRLVDISPPSPPPSPVVDTPVTSGSVALRPPTRPSSAPKPAPPPAVSDAPMVEEPAEMATEMSPPPEVSAVADAAPAPESAPAAPAAPASTAVDAAPEPETVVTPQPEDEPTVTAAVEPAAAVAQPSPPATPGTIAVLFPPGGAELPGDAQPQLDSVVAALGADSAVRLQLKAYADGADGAASAARRLSLSRALAVRGYLIDSGISSTRIDVRALGSKFESGPADRVDVISVK